MTPKDASNTFDTPRKSPILKTSHYSTRAGVKSVENEDPNIESDEYLNSRRTEKGLRKPKIKRKKEKGRLKGNFKRRLWTKEEDEAITNLVQQHGTRKWTLISKKLQEKFNIHGRYGKQCRER